MMGGRGPARGGIYTGTLETDITKWGRGEKDREEGGSVRGAGRH